MATSYRSGNCEVVVSDALQRMTQHVIEQAAPVLGPAMERLIKQAHAEVVSEWPDGKDKERFIRQRTEATKEAKEARRIQRMLTGSAKGITYWDYMPSPYRPKGWRATGRSKKNWKWKVGFEGDFVLVARLTNDTIKGGARYPWMAKGPPPLDTKTYWRHYASPAIRSRSKELIEAMRKESARLFEVG